VRFTRQNRGGGERVSVDPRAPCLVGVAQFVSRPEDGPAPEPLEQWAQVCTDAAVDTGAAGVLGAVDDLQIVYCQSWPYDDPPGRLGECLGIEPRRRYYSGIGGTTPQVLVNRAAERILRGEADVALVCGAEALDTKRRLKKDGQRPQWSHRDPEKKPFPFEAPFHDAEVAHEVFQAWLTFAVWDVARRAHLGVEPDDYRRRLGELLAPMTQRAAANPYAWFPVERGVDELIEPTADNRLVGYPYTKYMVSVMDVDMAAALVLTSHEKADELGVPADRRVYLRGWSYATDPVYVAERPEMWRSTAMREASRAALARAGVTIDDVAHLDLYSCFASSINFALDALGLEPGDRPVTVTGGLPFAGGAGSDYMTHSIAAMAGVLRGDPGSLGLVSGVGMHMTKHVFAVYGTEPGPVEVPDDGPVQAAVEGEGTMAIANPAPGPATIAAYSVVHGRDSEREWGLVVGDRRDGTRAYARVGDAEVLAAMEREEWVGREVELVPDGERNVVAA